MKTCRCARTGSSRICTGDERLKDAHGRKVHPTQKPEALLARVLLSSSNPGDVVLDPFFGSGTTGAVAKMLGRNFIGLERDPTYAKAARKRIDAVEPLSDVSIAAAPEKRTEVRVPFLSLIEAGHVKAGETLVDERRRHKAVVRADGTLALGAIVGSIHKIGALTQGLPVLQRLDLLERGAWRQARLHRRVPRQGAGGAGGLKGFLRHLKSVKGLAVRWPFLLAAR